MSLGPVMVDLEGTALQPEERELLCHPRVGAVILFSRNYESPEQLRALLAEIHALRHPRLLVAVDHEGGRVQRFREGFTHLPPARLFGDIYDHDRARALRLAERCGWLMAVELRAVGVDFSLAPVLDVDEGRSRVIGDRSFHRDPEVVAELARAYIEGMHRAGMAATGKHFPGHGAVEGDSHHTLPEDPRDLTDLELRDLVPFRRLAGAELAAVMPAHVVYPRVDPEPAGYSRFWLREVLRRRLGFQGLVFSDDLSMEGAAGVGGMPERAEAALAAGCDMVLVCNDREGAVKVVDGLGVRDDAVLHARLARMHGRHEVAPAVLHRDPAWREASHVLRDLADNPSLDLEL
ncbi:MAG TPA: beta-N-acetylhexosaminidase [Gammaproteobacteria bacterium]|nr:beta-N-acetylhexosaminidase [Gammaproteobacteria bacterium]